MVATAPSQVFTWDITRLAGPDKCIWYHADVIIDIFSRYIVGHNVERAESAERAEELIREAIERNGIVPETVHADRGTPAGAGTTRFRPWPGRWSRDQPRLRGEDALPVSAWVLPTRLPPYAPVGRERDQYR
ncbi:DDE-type integrase/transposase/recombinase [Streptomyces sp. NPDC054765]